MKVTAIIVMGVSGCGKSSVAQALTQRLQQESLSATMLEGDEFHPQANIEKMRSGQALDDQDREPWLLRLNEELRSTLAKGEFAVLACSALKQKYRDLLSQGIESPIWIHLNGSFDLIEARMKARQHKYMPASLLRSQFETLEPPQQAINLNIEDPIETLVDQALRQLRKRD
jgi:carbohydrate kinase (thermoresistant glucokinase family)